jgi:hypothetical protein
MIRDPRDDIRHDTYDPTTRAPTVGVANRHKMKSFAQMSHKTRHDGYCRDADEIFHICSEDKLQEALRCDVIEPTLSVATPTVATPISIPNQPKRTIETSYDTVLTN